MEKRRYSQLLYHALFFMFEKENYYYFMFQVFFKNFFN